MAVNALSLTVIASNMDLILFCLKSFSNLHVDWFHSVLDNKFYIFTYWLQAQCQWLQELSYCPRCNLLFKIVAKGHCHLPNDCFLHWLLFMTNPIPIQMDLWQLLLLCLIWGFSTKIDKVDKIEQISVWQVVKYLTC